MPKRERRPQKSKSAARRKRTQGGMGFSIEDGGFSLGTGYGKPNRSKSLQHKDHSKRKPSPRPMPANLEVLTYDIKAAHNLLRQEMDQRKDSDPLDQVGLEAAKAYLQIRSSVDGATALSEGYKTASELAISRVMAQVEEPDMSPEQILQIHQGIEVAKLIVHTLVVHPNAPKS